MREGVVVAIYLVVVSLISFAVAFGLDTITGIPYTGSSNVYVDEYTVTLYGNGTLVENITYVVTSSGYHVLYRSWREDLGVGVMGARVVVQRIMCSGGVPYASTPNLTYVYDNDTWRLARIRYAEANEVGCFFPDGVPQGRHFLVAVYRVAPPLIHDPDNHRYVFHWTPAENHVPYRRFRITVRDSGAEEVYTVPAARVMRSNDSWVIETGLYEDEALNIYIVYPEDPGALPLCSSIEEKPGFYSRVRDEAVKAEAWANAAAVITEVFRILLLALPAIILLVYIAYGRELGYVAPRVTGTPPTQRKPWLVNLVFHGDAMRIDEGAFYATLVDLHRRGAIEIRSDGSIVLRGDPGDLDVYESRVYRFLEYLSENGVVTPESVKTKLRTISYATARALSGVLRADEELRRIASEYVSTRGRNLLLAIMAVLTAVPIAIVFLGSQGILLPPTRSETLLGIGVIGVAGLAVLMVTAALPSHILGRYRGEYYREKLLWDAYRRYLESEEAWMGGGELTEKTAYALALGAIDKAREKMPPGLLTSYAWLAGLIAYRETTRRYYRRYTSGGGAGGGGGGGGFGGGGAGAR